jgi:protein-tyrosine phosphatase
MTPPPVAKTWVMFVCMGNICRSPTAEAVFKHRAQRAGLADRLFIASSGTHGSHEGDPPDQRAIAAGKRRGYDLSAIRSRPLLRSDYQRFHYMLGMDAHNLRILNGMKPADCKGYIGRLLDFAPHLGKSDIVDPYYGSEHQFEEVLDQIEAGADGLIAEIVRRIG